MEMNFEDKLQELENIVEKLENGQISLDESLGLFEKGIKLARECDTDLKAARQKVEKLIEENNELRREPFEMREDNGVE